MSELAAAPGDPLAPLLVRSYLGSLQSAQSRRTVAESLLRAARALGAPSAEHVPWTALGLDELNALRLVLARDFAPSTANLTLSAVRQLLKIAHVQGHTDSRQRAALDLVKAVSGARLDRGRALSEDEERRLRRAARELAGHAGVMVEVVISTCIGAGLRRDEACRMALRAYDVAGRTLRVLGKGNRERELPVDADMRRGLARWLALRDELAPSHGALFCSPADVDRPMSPWSLSSVIRDLAAEADVPMSGAHDLRRTFSTRLLSQGFDLREVQRLMGHANIATTARYDKRAYAQLMEKRRQAVVLASE